jgi:hypothetical protein
MNQPLTNPPALTLKTDCVLPPEGHVFAICRTFENVALVVGYCRGVVFVGREIFALGAFQRASDPALSCSWAHAHEIDLLPLAGTSLDPIPEKDWMRRSARPGLTAGFRQDVEERI